MDIKETAAPKISAQELDKLNSLKENLSRDKFESTTAADEKVLQRLEGQRETETSPDIHEDSEVNSGQSVDVGFLLCSDRCVKSRVNSGRCFHY